MQTHLLFRTWQQPFCEEKDYCIINASISGIHFPYNVLTHSWTHPHLSCISRVPLSSWVDLLWAPARHALQGSKGRPTSAHHKPAGQLASCRRTSKGEGGSLKLVQLHLYRKVHVYQRSPWIDKCMKYLMFTRDQMELDASSPLSTALSVDGRLVCLCHAPRHSMIDEDTHSWCMLSSSM